MGCTGVQTCALPISGQSGKKLTARLLKNRLDAELVGHVSIRVLPTERPDTWEVQGRGELQQIGRASCREKSVDLGGRRIIQKNTKKLSHIQGTRRSQLCDECSVSFFFATRRRHTIYGLYWSSDLCSSDLRPVQQEADRPLAEEPPRRGARRQRLDPRPADRAAGHVGGPGPRRAAADRKSVV